MLQQLYYIKCTKLVYCKIKLSCHFLKKKFRLFINYYLLLFYYLLIDFFECKKNKTKKKTSVTLFRILQFEERTLFAPCSINFDWFVRTMAEPIIERKVRQTLFSRDSNVGKGTHWRWQAKMALNTGLVYSQQQQKHKS